MGKLLERMRKQQQAAATALTGVNSTVAEIRAEIAGLNNALADLELRPIARAEAEAAVDRGLAEMAAARAYRIKIAVRAVVSGDGFGLAVEDPALRAPVARDEVMQQLASIYANDAGLTDAQRSDERARIEAERLDLEIAEEALIRTANTTGISITRRNDAHPAAILAPDAAMPT